MWGYFKKVVIADNAAVVVNKIFALQGASFPIIWAGVFAFAVQIYADFSGYTDIARGTARLLGIDLMVNFNHPYLATSPADFWRRWHISLSTWLRDFIYIPLGGSRCSTARASFNLMATFAISGLWHGASWNFVLWGVYWGAAHFGAALSGLAWINPEDSLVRQGRDHLRHHLFWLAPFPRAESRADRARPRAVALRRLGGTMADGDLFRCPGFDLCLAADHPHARDWDSGRAIDARLSDRGRFILETAVAVVLLLGIVTIRSVATSDFIYFQF